MRFFFPLSRLHCWKSFTLNAASPDNLPEYPIISYPGYHQRRIGCLGAGNRYLYIDPKGDIHACPFCRHAAGDAFSASMEDVIKVLRNRGCQIYKTNMDAN